MLRKALSALGGALVGFHVWLLASQVWTGQIADLTVLGRWIAALGLVGALLVLRRQGASLFFGRKAVAIWALAALLHGPALAQANLPDVQALPEIGVTLAQATLAGAILLGLTLFGLFAAAPVRRPAARRSVVRPMRIGAVSSDPPLVFAPRPPPVA